MERRSMIDEQAHGDVVYRTVHVVSAPPPDRRVGKSETIPRWGPTSRLALGLITLMGPVLATTLGVWAIVENDSPPPVLLGAAFGFFIAHCLMTFFYLAFAGQNPRLRSRTRWQLALILAGPITIPIYWFIHVWGAPRIGTGDTDYEVPGMDVGEARRMALAT